MFINIPKNVKYIIKTLYNNGFEAFMVGGCVRDSLLNIIPHDYDITTSAIPEKTLSLFDKTIPTGLQHGTVTVLIDKEPFEITTYRTEEKYINNRKPEKVNFVTNIEEDLSRRDFTINAFAYNDKIGLLDFFNGKDDLDNKIVRSVGNADIRFQEDALRMLRAIRFSCQLNFSIEENTFNAIQRNYKLINNISKERIRDELCKIITSDNPVKGVNLLNESSLLELILPELYRLIRFHPNCNNHNKNIFEHTLNVLNNIRTNSLPLRLAALFHDIGKYNSIEKLEDGTNYFPNHHIESEKLTNSILTRLKFDNKTIKEVCLLVKYHMHFTSIEMPTTKEIKKLINDVGIENIFNLFLLQEADILSIPNSKIYLAKLSKIRTKINTIIDNKDPLTIKDLEIDGSILIEELNFKADKTLGLTLNKLLDLVLENPSLNKKETLIELAYNLH